MENKKNPKAEINQKSGFYFNLSLTIVLLISNTAFEWKIYEDMPVVDLTELEFFDKNSRENMEDAEDTELPQPNPNTKPSVKTKENTGENSEEEVILEVNLDIALEGQGFDNSFLDRMTLNTEIENKTL